MAVLIFEEIHHRKSPLIIDLLCSSVAEGIQLFKEGKHVEAMQHLNKALQIDADNVEALVARGAL